MKIIIGCEYSGTVRDEFLKRGHEVISCDILPTEKPGPHFQGDIFELLQSSWGLDLDLFIAHPPCTRLCNSGVLRLYKGGKKANGIDPVKWREMEEGAAFFKALYNWPSKGFVGENPVPHSYAVERIGAKYSQTIQPYEFGEDASKKTCLWLKNVPLLKKTSRYPGRIVNGREVWSNQTDSGQNNLGPSDDRAKLRAKTYDGIARAMAEQWG